MVATSTRERPERVLCPVGPCMVTSPCGSCREKRVCDVCEVGWAAPKDDGPEVPCWSCGEPGHAGRIESLLELASLVEARERSIRENWERIAAGAR